MQWDGGISNNPRVQDNIKLKARMRRSIGLQEKIQREKGSVSQPTLFEPSFPTRKPSINLLASKGKIPRLALVHIKHIASHSPPSFTCNFVFRTEPVAVWRDCCWDKKDHNGTIMRNPRESGCWRAQCKKWYCQGWWALPLTCFESCPIF